MKILNVLIVFFDMFIFAVGAFIIGWIVFPILSIFVKGKNRRRVFSNIIHKTWQFFVHIMDVTRVAKANSQSDLSNIKNKIVVASHPSLIDIVFLISMIPNSLCFAKKALLNNPFMRNIVKSLYIINDIDTETLKKSSKEVLQEGYNIIIFPTGTRTLPNEKMKIHKGAALLAIDNDVNIVPIKITTDFPFLAKNQNPFNVAGKPVNYYFDIMPEIDIKKFKEEETNETKLRQRISEAIKQSLN